MDTRVMVTNSCGYFVGFVIISLIIIGGIFLLSGGDTDGI
jgi:hypothetical protein